MNEIIHELRVKVIAHPAANSPYTNKSDELAANLVRGTLRRSQRDTDLIRFEVEPA